MEMALPPRGLGICRCASRSAYCSKNSGWICRKRATSLGSRVVVMAIDSIRKVDFTGERRYGWAGHEYRLVVAGPCDGKFAAVRGNAHRGVEQAAAYARHSGGAGAGAAGQSLAGAAFEDAQTDRMAILDLH